MSIEPRRNHAWYGSRTPPEDAIIAAAEAVEQATNGSTVLYDHETHEGEWAEVVSRIYNEMDSLKRYLAEFRTWTAEDSMAAFFQALLDYVPTDIRSRVAILQQFGQFKFRAADGPDEKKQKIASIFVEPDDEEDYKSIRRIQVRKLSDSWVPNEGSLLDCMINQPAQVGRVLSDRLSPTTEKPFKIIGHPFLEVRSTDLQEIAASKTVAYERESAIHIVTDVCEVLEQWDADAEGAGGCEQFTLLDALLLHEEDPEIDVLNGHIIATTFERYLKDTLLSVACEDFFLAWPQPSSQEIAEKQKAEMEEQQAAFAAFLDDEDPPDDLDDDIDDLPMDTNVAPPIKKKKAARKKAAEKDGDEVAKSKEGKLFNTKSGQHYRIIDGKKGAVK